VIKHCGTPLILIVTGFPAAHLCSIVEILSAPLGEAQTAQLNMLQAN
jgi:hypothetical protein